MSNHIIKPFLPLALTMNRFPPELLDTVADNLEKSDLNSMGHTNRVLHSICNRRLYKAVTIDNAAQALRFFRTVARSAKCARLVRELNVALSLDGVFASFARVLRAAASNLTALIIFSIPQSPQVLNIISGLAFPALRACNLPAFGPNTVSFLRRHQRLQRLRVFRRGQDSFTTSGSYAPVDLPELTSFCGPAVLVPRLLASSPISHLLVNWLGQDIETVDYAALLSTVNKRSGADVHCAVHILGGWQPEIFMAIAVNSPALQALCLGTRPGAGGLKVDQRLIDDIAPAMAQLTSLLWIRFFENTSARDTPDTGTDNKNILASELALACRLGELCPRLISCGFGTELHWIRPYSNVWTPLGIPEGWNEDDLVNVVASNEGLKDVLELGREAVAQAIERIKAQDLVFQGNVVELLTFNQS
ncbi:hypothetical protein MKEN_01327700 [Mycena kentingensis (nom. inval.)]|nr:hypothetical protein MKEN_01327700 [Mycena kentingensis (nom. inval.)]